jgi:hypothetical protein
MRVYKCDGNEKVDRALAKSIFRRDIQVLTFSPHFGVPCAEIAAEAVKQRLTLNMVPEFGAGQGTQHWRSQKS